ncbi:PREDICTED: peroxidase 64-like isoform X2 [Nelumbo nucifera]|uniref:Peroxidase 64-like isoform X2 n=2 Tax=Nelumbo nucifera TaxID=4432 RepID=A0A1U8BNJ3_NELNU|nr:PREDICTED: peroxidase 64-like isoform X2 [Nelumbo nucifera]DAD23381.1 TPA_asm: hypothetical protein HUJ06_024844 [Nelumbo nucifera]
MQLLYLEVLVGEVPKGRKDGRVSKASRTRQLPAPTFNISQLQQSFSQRGLSMADLVTLSGRHTLGFTHCSSFQNRIHNFSPNSDIDPSMNQAFVASLRSVCPLHNKFSGYVLEHSAYHHGEQSLMSTIIGMAQDY